jgi:hypothetical protein
LNPISTAAIAFTASAAFAASAAFVAAFAASAASAAFATSAAFAAFAASAASAASFAASSAIAASTAASKRRFTFERRQEVDVQQLSSINFCHSKLGVFRCRKLRSFLGRKHRQKLIVLLETLRLHIQTTGFLSGRTHRSYIKNTSTPGLDKTDEMKRNAAR